MELTFMLYKLAYVKQRRRHLLLYYCGGFLDFSMNSDPIKYIARLKIASPKNAPVLSKRKITTHRMFSKEG